MPGGLYPHTPADSSLLQIPIELLGFSITVVQSPFATLSRFCIRKRDLLITRVVIYAYIIMFGSFLPSPWLVGTTKVYSGVGADIVMESIALIL